MITAILSEISTFRVQPGKLVQNVARQLVDKIRNRRNGVNEYSAVREQDTPILTRGFNTDEGYQDEPADHFMDETEIGQYGDDTNNAASNNEHLGPEVDFPLAVSYGWD